MYGMPARRFDPDVYKDRKKLKQFDFAAGFVLSALFWFLLFKPVWYIAPILIFCVCMAGLKLKFDRRYLIYGALGLVFFPFLLVVIWMIFWAGKDELK